jgi:ADP-ribosylglycohydrolase
MTDSTTPQRRPGAHLTSAQADRAAGVLLATACGDALGAAYEFGPPLLDDAPVAMIGGGPFGWAPGEWTDDTSMAILIARAAATGADLRDEAVLDGITAGWVSWAREAKDVGVQTSAVLRSLKDPTAAAVAESARQVHQRTGCSGGNGSLMRTAPVALAYLDDPEVLAEAATRISALTHYDPEAGEACAIWCLGIRHAVVHGTFDGVRDALLHLPAERAMLWSERLDAAESNPPSHFARNGWVVEALQGAWSAITRTPVPVDDPAASSHPAQHLRLALEAAVRGGHDTDTVAAIAGGLLGARWGVSAIPAQWRRAVHGWPVDGAGNPTRARQLTDLATLTVKGGPGSKPRWPGVPTMPYAGWSGTEALTRHPHDHGVWLSGVDALDSPPEGVEAVVTMCRIGTEQTPPGVAAGDHVEVWLLDEPDADHNPNLDQVLADTADTVAALRAEGRTVLLHCVAAHSRTPTVAALYAHRHLGIPMDRAIADVCMALPAASPNPGFRAALYRLSR